MSIERIQCPKCKTWREVHPTTNYGCIPCKNRKNLLIEIQTDEYIYQEYEEAIKGGER